MGCARPAQCVFFSIPYRYFLPLTPQSLVRADLPHRLTKDDIYEGMFIPKGAFIFGNIWAILRDPTLYPDPDAFKPERWLQSQGDDEQEKKRDPRAYVFGFGRR